MHSQRDGYHESRRPRHNFKQEGSRHNDGRSDPQDYYYENSHYEDRRSNDRYTSYNNQNYPSRQQSGRYYDNSESQYYNPRERSPFEHPGTRERSLDGTSRKNILADEKLICEIIQDEYLHNPPIEVNAAPYFFYPTTWD